MRLEPLIASLGVVLGSVCGAVGCVGGQGPEVTPPDSVPLDGRGGGVIAYSIQPGPLSGIHEIFGINADGSGGRRLIEAGIGLNHHDWAPDGRRMVAVGYASATTWSIYVFDLQSGAPTRLTQLIGAYDTEPAWFPDGSRIVFTRMFESGSGRSELWVMNADGTGQRSLGVEGFGARWSPDGRRLVFASDRGGNWDLYLCDADGTNVTRLLGTPSAEQSPVWSPDGSEIAYTSDADGDHEVFVMASDGSNARQLTHNAAADHYPKWSPDGSLIAFDSDLPGAGHFEVYVVPSDGSSSRRVTETSPPRTAIVPAWKPGSRLSCAFVLPRATPGGSQGDRRMGEWTVHCR